MQQFLGKLRLRTEEDGFMSTPFKMTLAILLGLIGGIIAMVGVDYAYKQELTLRTQTIATTIGANRLNDLKQSTDTISQQREYQLLKITFAQLKYVNENARYIYLLGNSPSGVYTLADSESPDSPRYSPRGASHNVSLTVRELFDNPRPLIETAVTDRGGTWLVAFAPVVDNVTGKAVALIGMDIPVTSYYSILVISGLLPIMLGMLAAAAIVLLDKTRQRKLEALRFRSELVSIASHELRTPLTGIRWSEETLLKDTTLGKKQHTAIEEMFESTLRLQESIEDVLQLANLQSKNATLIQKAPTGVTNIIQSIFSMQKLPAAEHAITLKFADDWPQDLMITCDMVRMKRVFNNVISNAIKYTRPHTSVVVGYEKVDGNHLITIADQGIGIPEKEQSKVFSGFYRATNAVQAQTNGTGMGLYLSKTVVEQHGGKMWLHSKVNKGTTVYIQLP